MNITIFDEFNIQDFSRADNGSAGYDIRSAENNTIHPNSMKMIKTGLYMEIPEGIELQIRSRSGLANKNNVFVLNSPGTVDSSYRGEICVLLYNLGDTAFVIEKGDRIAQGVFAKYGTISVILKVDSKEELSKTERGEEGFGHSGVR